MPSTHRTNQSIDADESSPIDLEGKYDEVTASWRSRGKAGNPFTQIECTINGRTDIFYLPGRLEVRIEGEETYKAAEGELSEFRKEKGPYIKSIVYGSEQSPNVSPSATGPADLLPPQPSFATTGSSQSDGRLESNHVPSVPHRPSPIRVPEGESSPAPSERSRTHPVSSECLFPPSSHGHNGAPLPQRSDAHVSESAFRRWYPRSIRGRASDGAQEGEGASDGSSSSLSRWSERVRNLGRSLSRER